MPSSFPDLTAVAKELRALLASRSVVLLYAYNGTGKTRLSSAFKDLGKAGGERDTLYFNAFTEDLFYWDNDLQNDRERVLRINKESRFFAGLVELEMDTRIRHLLNRYADFEFAIDTDAWEITFAREFRRSADGGEYQTVREEDIKISRGEENIFVWCFFLAIVQLTLDGAEAYKWVKYIYIDDPISSLDEHNAIVVANHLVQVMREAVERRPTVISTHHHLFFNVLYYELKSNFKGASSHYVLSRDRLSGGYRTLQQKGDTPSFHHVAALAELFEVSKRGEIRTYHFNVLRTILEKTALFHGYGHFGNCIRRDPDDAEGILHQRFVDLLSHGKYSIFEPTDMGDETRGYFHRILGDFLERFPFNPALFPSDVKQDS
jgi:hypothetical protein